MDRRCGAAGGARRGMRPRGILVAALLAAAALLPGCQGRPDAPLRGFNLVVVNVDTLRADHLGFHGYPRPTSPFLDRLAAQGVVFERAISNSSITRESVAALLTGRLPSASGSAGWNAAPAPGSAHLGERLAAAGYRTGFFSNTVMLKDPAFTRGFEEVQHLPARWDLSGEGPRLSERALRFVAEAGGAPFALYLHYLDPHAPYDPAREFLARFTREELPPNLDLYRDVEPHLAALRAGGFGPGDPRFDAMVLRYDAEIAATDAAIEQLVTGLGAAGVLDRTLLVVTSDHGEEFLEHGFVEHGWTLFEESIHVPLLFHAPAALAPARTRVRVSQVDVLPTLAGLLGLPLEVAPLDGVPILRGEGPGVRPATEDRLQRADLLIPFRNVLRSATLGDWKLVAAHRWIPPEARKPEAGAASAGPVTLDLTRPPVREMLYDLATDPGEQDDRKEIAPDALTQLRPALGGTAPVRPAGGAPAVSREEQERLRALGYH